MSKLWVSAGLKVAENQSPEQVTQALIELQKQTITEPGCLFFDVLQHKDDPKLFTLWEEWENEEALSNHFQLEHTKGFLAQSLTDIVYIEKLVKRT